jgi:hypothetical protein
MPPRRHLPKRRDLKPADLAQLLCGRWLDDGLAAELYRDHRDRIVAFAERSGRPAVATCFFDPDPLVRRAAIDATRARRLAQIDGQEKLGNLDVAGGMREDLDALMADLGD